MTPNVAITNQHFCQIVGILFLLLILITGCSNVGGQAPTDPTTTVQLILPTIGGSSPPQVITPELKISSPPVEKNDTITVSPTPTPTIAPRPVMEWSIRTLDSQANVDGFFSLAVDSQGNPHIVYLNEIRQNHEVLLYNTRRGGDWLANPTQVMTNADMMNMGQRAGYMASIAISPDGVPHVSYMVLDTRRVYVSTRNGSSWRNVIVEAIATDRGSSLTDMDTSLGIGNDGNMHLVFLDPDQDYLLKYYVNRIGTWERVDNNSPVWVDPTGVTVPLAVNQNIASIVYYNNGLYYLPLTGAWTPQLIESGARVGLLSSLAFDHHNQPHIAYYDGTNNLLKYAHLENGEWVIEIVDSDITIGRYTGIVMDPDGGTHICYYDKLNGDLRYAYRAQGGLVFETTIVDSQGTVGTFSSIGLNANNLPMIIYFDDDRKTIKLAELTIK